MAALAALATATLLACTAFLRAALLALTAFFIAFTLFVFTALRTTVLLALTALTTAALFVLTTFATLLFAGFEEKKLVRGPKKDAELFKAVAFALISTIGPRFLLRPRMYGCVHP